MRALTMLLRSARFAWKLAYWPFRHRRLPNRTDAHHLVQHLRHIVKRPVNRKSSRDPYEVWLENNRWTPLAVAAAQRDLAELPRRPLISVVMPVHNVEARWLERAIESVRSQIYPEWELSIAEDCATFPHVRPLLRRHAAEDSRIRIRYLDKNVNISRASNAAADLANGEFLLFLDQDDELSPDCLLEVAKAIVAAPDADIIYSDDDKIDLSGQRYAPVFKPDWSPELLLSFMYFGHVFAVRRELFEAEGGFRPGFEGCQDYDLALRLTDRSRRIVHIPRILYHWRCLPTSTASSGAAKPEAFERGRRAVQETLSRRRILANASRPEFAVRRHLGLFQIDFPDTGPRVAVVIHSWDRIGHLRRCVDSLRSRTNYRDYEIVVIDRGNDDPVARSYFSKLPLGCRVLQLPGKDEKLTSVNVLNESAVEVNADYLLFLSGDTVVNRPEWLSQMIGYAQMGGVGAVGARLLFPHKAVAEAGILVGSSQSSAIPAYRELHGDDDGYMCTALTARDCSAVSANCLLVRRETFQELGGFDRRFSAAYHDVDLCLRLSARGLRSVFVPRAELTTRHWSMTTAADHAADLIAFRELWDNYRDPYYSSNLAMTEPSHHIETRRLVSSAPARPPKVLFCTHNLNLEGAPLSLYELARGLAERGDIEPHVFCHQDGPLGDLYREAEIPVHVDPEMLRARPDTDSFKSCASRFGEWMQSEGFDVLLANTLDTFWAIHGARIARIPSLWIIRESYPNMRRYYEVLGPWMVGPALQTFALPYRIVFVAHATRKLYEPLSGYHNMSVIPNGLRRDAIDRFRKVHNRDSLRKELNLPADRTVFTIVGSVCERKGQLEFARAAARLIDQGRRDVLFLIVGCCPSEYQTRVDEFVEGRSEFFRLIPTTNKTLHYLLASDVFMCCSRNESYPRVILEAMACEVPIVTTPVFGIAEQVSHEFSALTYSPGDVETLSEQMNRLANDRDERDRLRAGALRQLDSLTSYERMLAEYERLIIEAAMTRAASTEIHEMSGTETGVK